MTDDAVTNDPVTNDPLTNDPVPDGPPATARSADAHAATASATGGPAANRSTSPRLPFGPFGMLVVTAVALIIAGLAAWGASAVLSSSKKSETVDLSEALDDFTFTPAGKGGSPAKIGELAPNVELDVIGGEPTELAAIAGRGKPMVLNFWSSTCAPCLKEMPAFESVHSDVGDKVTFLGINTQDTEKAAKEMISKTGVTYDSARDPRGEISTRFGAFALPRTVLLDGKGKIVATHTGELSREKLVKLLSDHQFPTP